LTHTHTHDRQHGDGSYKQTIQRTCEVGSRPRTAGMRSTEPVSCIMEFVCFRAGIYIGYTVRAPWTLKERIQVYEYTGVGGGGLYRVCVSPSVLRQGNLA